MSTLDLINKLHAALDERERWIEGTGVLGWLTYRNPDGVMRYTTAASCPIPTELWVVNGEEVSDWAESKVVYDEERERQMIAAHREILKWAIEAISMCTVSPGGVLSQPGEHMMGDIGRWNVEALAKAYGIDAEART